MAFAVAHKQVAGAAVKQCPRNVASPASRLAVAVRAARDNQPVVNRDTGFVSEDNSGRANIFPTKQAAYIKSSTKEAAARQGLGGAQGGILVGVLLGAVALITLATTNAPGPETLQTVSSAFDGDSLAAIAARVEASL